VHGSLGVGLGIHASIAGRRLVIPENGTGGIGRESFLDLVEGYH